MAKVAQRRDGGRSADVIDSHASVPLKTCESKISVITKDSINPTRVKPEGGQPFLELGDVIATQERTSKQ
jgi:hypothetical protein